MAPGSALIPRLADLSPGTEALRYCFALPAHPESVAGARELTRTRLDAWRLGRDLGDAAVLIVSELVTNAIVHTASTRVVCELSRFGRRLRIAVQDQGHQPCGPRLRPSSDEEHGRGLLLVEAMSSAWGSHDAQDASGRIVWAELAHGAEQLSGTDRPC
ncbi:ATP-binding protein [Streptomyces rubiginosohelvolus]